MEGRRRNDSDKRMGWDGYRIDATGLDALGSQSQGPLPSISWMAIETFMTPSDSSNMIE
jgi:hypothetical protein